MCVKPAATALAMESFAVALLYCHVPAASCGIITPLFSLREGFPARERVATAADSILC
jgi:hypothetical protein